MPFPTDNLALPFYWNLSSDTFFRTVCSHKPKHSAYMLLVDFPSLKDFEDVVSVEYRIEIHLGEQFSLRGNTLHLSCSIIKGAKVGGLRFGQIL